MKYGVLLSVSILFVLACGAPAIVQATSTPAATPTPNTGKWITTLDTSSFDDSKTVVLKLPAESTIQAWLDTPLPYLVIRCKEHILESYIFAGTQFAVESNVNISTVRVRFDKDQAMTLSMHQSDDGKGIFFGNPPATVDEILKHNTMLVGFTPFNAVPVEASFDLRGFSNAVQPLKEACP